MNILVVGAGLSGCVAARQFASAGHSVTVVESRAHVAGHAADSRDPSGAMIHLYGPHLFHTNNRVVVDYLSRFTQWLPHEHRLVSSIEGKLVPVPINIVTLRELLGREFTPDQMRQYLASVSIRLSHPIATSEDFLLSTYGPDLTDLFFRDYIRKQWGRELNQLSASVAARIQPRLSTDCRTFLDEFQAIPAHGYTALCQSLLDHPRIQLFLGTSFRAEGAALARPSLLVYTGPIDHFFACARGPLPYRSLRFEHRPASSPLLAPTIVFPSAATQFTRMTDWRQVAGDHLPDPTGGTTILTEYPTDDPTAEPMYPVPAADASALYARYEEMAATRKDVLFCGRLGLYRYMNMDACVADTLSRVEPLL